MSVSKLPKDFSKYKLTIGPQIEDDVNFYRIQNFIYEKDVLSVLVQVRNKETQEIVEEVFMKKLGEVIVKEVKVPVPVQPVPSRTENFVVGPIEKDEDKPVDDLFSNATVVNLEPEPAVTKKKSKKKIF